MPQPGPFEQWLAQEERTPAIEPQRTDASLPLLVVGAGAAGLAGMAAFHRSATPYVGIELHDQVGGIWDTTNPLSSVYEGMHTVTSRHTTHLGTPMPDDWPIHVPHAQAHGYLVKFAQDEQLLPHLRFGTSFETACKTPQGTWRVTLRSKDGGTYEEAFRGIVFATGSHHRGLMMFAEKLKAQALGSGVSVIHSSEYKSPRRFAGKRVLIVGMGNSGSDIADKISTVAKRTILSVRTTPWISPLTFRGVACDTMDRNNPSWMSKTTGFRIFHLIRWLSVGGYRRLGLPRPKHRMIDRLSINDRGIIDAIRNGRVAPRSNVVEIKEGIASFANTRHAPEPIDVVIFATGFSRSYPLLNAPGASVDEVADSLSFLLFHRSEPGLTYLAEAIGTRGCWPIFVEQARTIASYFQAEANDAPNIRRFNCRRHIATPDVKGELLRKADRFHVDYDIYAETLRRLSAWLVQSAHPLDS